nr:hypothetical protein [Variovorax boronicumulans]
MNFTVIQGGLAEEASTAPQADPHRLDHAVEAEHFRKALLALIVPETGLTVVEALEEICALLEEKTVEQIERGAFLSRAVETLGIHFRLVDPSLELSRPGFLTLAVPQQLLQAHPALARFHPHDHQNLVFG